MVSPISSSVSESSDEVASSKTSRCGRRSSARAIESRCFSPPDTFTPPSPITVSRPRSARASRLSHAALRSTSRHSASVADGLTNSRFSRIDAREELGVLRHEADALAQLVRDRRWRPGARCRGCRRPAAGTGPTSSLTSVVLPAPDGPTKAIVSPRPTSNEMSVSAGDDADWCCEADVVERQACEARAAAPGWPVAAPAACAGCPGSS